MIVLVPADIHDELAAEAATIAPSVSLVSYREDQDPVPFADDAVAVFRWIAGVRYAGLVENGPNVRWLHTASAGTDHVITDAIRNKPGLTVTDSGPAFEIAIAEFVMACMLSVTRRLPTLWERQQRKQWEWLTQDEVWGKSVGIVGLGPIGVGVARRAKAFGMRTLGLRRRDLPAEAVDEVLTGRAGLDRILAESDFVLLAAALTPETRSLIGAAELRSMKNSAWLLNIARGSMVDDAALIAALQSGEIAGACLDVFAKEPLPQDHPFWSMPNVMVSPHSSSGWTAGLKARQKAIFLDNLKRFVDGAPLEHVVDFAAGY